MKRILLYILVAVCLVGNSSCKKAIDKEKENIVLNLMTSGRWYLEKITEQGFDITSDYAGYEFQFYKNNTLDAIKNNVVQSVNWSGTLSSLTFTSNFPGAGDPLDRLNHLWTIKDYYIDLVFAEADSPNGVITIRFRKK